MKNLSILTGSIDSTNLGKIYLVTDTVSNSTELVVFASREDAENQAHYQNFTYPGKRCIVKSALIYLG